MHRDSKPRKEKVWRASLIYTRHWLLVGSGYGLLPDWRLQSNSDIHKHAKRPLSHDMSFKEVGVNLRKLLTLA